MLPFSTAQGASFLCHADFAAGPVLNLSFLDSARAAIPFHLSVRRDEGLVVVNRRDAAGWRREIRTPMTFAPVPVPVELLFSGGRVRVWVAGTPIGSFDAFPRPDSAGRLLMRRGFPGLAQIAFVEIDGPLVASSLVLTQRLPRQAGLHVNDTLELILPNLGATPRPGACVRVEGLDAPLPAVLRSKPGLVRGKRTEQALATVLPGRIWAQGAAEVALRLEDGDGGLLGQLSLSRTEVAARIARLAEAGTLRHDDRAALQALEHARWAGLVPAMPAAAGAELVAAARRFGLERWLAEGSDGTALPLPPTLALPAIADREAAAAAEGVTAALRRDPGQNPLPLAESALRGLTRPDAASALFVRLIEVLAQHDRLDDLLRQRRALRIPLPPTPDESDLYLRSLALPLDYAEGRFDRVTATLWAIAPPTPHWLSTPCIGWVMERAVAAAPDLDGRPPLDTRREEMLRATLDFLDARAPHYWERTPCLRLIRGLVALVFATETLPPALGERSLWLAARVYGLSPDFWRAVGAHRARTGQTLPPLLQPVEAAFRHLVALIDTGTAAPAALDAALDPFLSLGAVELARFRRDLFGPLGVPPGAAGGDGAPRRAGLDGEDAALRALAFPGGSIALGAGLEEAARRGLDRANPQLPAQPFGALQDALRKGASALLSGPAWDSAALHRWVARLPPLAGEQGSFLGLALPMLLARGLLARQRTDQALILLDRTRLMAESLDTPVTRTALARASLPRLALDALLREAGALPAVQELAQALTPLLPPSPGGPSDDRTADLSSAADPVQDTVLCLYSCRPYLDSRVRTIRETWLPLLAAMGVPALVFVGGGDGRREGDVVHLDAPDDYEGLPQKTLAMVRWVRDHTAFAHLVKVDDDCFLDPEVWFGDLAHRAVDYHGRRLTRVRGQMARAWHQAKSRSGRGRMDLDKSPEPSVYADGGSGYALSRVAMNALLDAADSPAGQELAQLSFMEDKLVGDLLAQRGIRLDSTGYRVSVLRHSRPGGPLVPAWENGFLPFRGAGVKLVHLDGTDRMAEVLAGRDAPRPAGGKIWPSFQPVRLGSRTNALDLLSTPARLAQVAAMPVAVVACLRNEMFLLPRFLDHYRALGVTGFLIADNGSDDGTLDYLAAQPDVALFAVDTEYGQSQYGVAWQQALLSSFRGGRWSLVADADELLFWTADRRGDLPGLLAGPAFAGADAARVFMLDMYPEGPLAAADFVAADPFTQAGFVDRDPFLAVSGARGPFSDAPIWTSALRHRLLPGSRAELFVAQKIALLRYRPWMRLTAGLHFVSGVRLAQRPLAFAHFKYNAQFHAKAQAEVARGQHFNNAEEYAKYLALVSEGRDVIHDPAVSVPWHEARFVQRLCAGEGPSE